LRRATRSGGALAGLPGSPCCVLCRARRAAWPSLLPRAAAPPHPDPWWQRYDRRRRERRQAASCCRLPAPLVASVCRVVPIYEPQSGRPGPDRGGRGGSCGHLRGQGFLLGTLRRYAPSSWRTSPLLSFSAMSTASDTSSRWVDESGSGCCRTAGAIARIAHGHGHMEDRRCMSGWSSPATAAAWLVT
jgi:hypothetical protein